MTAVEQSLPAKETQPKTIYLKDYQVPGYLIKTTDLRFEIYDGETIVSAMLHLYRNPAQ
ncbi:MAG: aminopeptidase [Cellvibrio sp.]|nr:aminopeptidase [Cellvibrio sp.]